MDDHLSENDTTLNSGNIHQPTVVIPVPLPVPIEPYGTTGYLLGQGGMGVVYRVRSRLEARDVALKVMQPDLARRDPNSRERFLREARSLSQVRHEHVVEIYYVGEAEGVPYLVMPLLEGKTLADYLKHQPDGIPLLEETLRIGQQIAAGLAAAHARGIVHRDVKPSNIWLEAPEQCVKLLDFGLARPTGGDTTLTRSDATVGTPAYMAPEQFEGGPVDGRSDLYSLGNILYRMVTGVLPFRGETPAQLYHQMVTRRPPSPRSIQPGVPPALSNLIDRLLARNPADRPSRATEVVNLLAGMQGSEPPTRTLPQPIQSRPGLSRRALLAGAGGALLLGGAITGFWYPGWALPGSGTSVEPATSGPRVDSANSIRFDLDVTVWKAGRRHLKGQRLWEAGIMPLGPGDALRLEAVADRPVYFYLVWLQADGTLKPGHPWQDEDWGRRSPNESPQRVLNLPESADEGFALGGVASGIEAFVLLAREEPLPPDVDLSRLLASWHSGGGPLADLALAAWLENGRPETASIRGGTFANQVKVNNPVGLVQTLTRALFEHQGLASRAVCFGYRGR